MSLWKQILAQNATKPSFAPGVWAKLEAMRAEKDAMFAASRSAGDSLRSAQEVVTRLEQERHEYEYGSMSGPARKAALDEIDKAISLQRVEIRRLTAKYEEINARTQAVGQPVAALERWIEDNRAVAVRPCPTLPRPPARPKDGWQAEVDRQRAVLRGLRADVHAVASAPIPAADAKARMRAEVAALAEAGAPDVGRCLEGGSIRWPTTTLRNVAGVPVAHEAIDAHGLWAWLNQAQLVALLDAEIDALAEPDRALTAAQRKAEDARLQAEILKTERQEEATIVAAAAEGVLVIRRADADPRAVFEIDDNVPGYRD